MKKIFLSFMAFFISISAFFALPSVTSSVPDFSGQFVYYKDLSFERESYIGILFYDESTYALRYYAPATGKSKSFKPEKNIHILFTLDSTKNYVELTGERILTAIAPEDTDLVNYIHDFLYERTKCRQNSGEVTEPKSDYQDYEQFGGKVTLYFNPLIPIFNLDKTVRSDVYGCMRESLEISRKTQGTTGPDSLKKTLKTQISASFFRGFLLDFEF